MGEKYVPPSPPKATFNSITDTGLVTIGFSEDMKQLSMLEVERITKHTPIQTETAAGKKEQVFELKLITGEFSDPSKMGYTWHAVSFDTRSLELQLVFENSIYISSEE